MMIHKVLTAKYVNINVYYVKTILIIVYNAKEIEVKEQDQLELLTALAKQENLMILLHHYARIVLKNVFLAS